MRILRGFLWVASGLAVIYVLTVAAFIVCSSSVSQRKVQQVSTGMKADQVVALLGQPTRIDHAEITSLTGDVYCYLSDNGNAIVVLVNGTVFSTQYIPGRKGL